MAYKRRTETQEEFEEGRSLTSGMAIHRKIRSLQERWMEVAVLQDCGDAVVPVVWWCGGAVFRAEHGWHALVGGGARFATGSCLSDCRTVRGERGTSTDTGRYLTLPYEQYHDRHGDVHGPASHRHARFLLTHSSLS